jgi:hypothetical protein
MHNPWIIIIGLTVFSITFRHILGPILIHAKTSQPVNRNFTELPVDYPLMHLPPTFPQKLYELEGLGFSLVGHLVLGDDQASVKGVISILVNRESKTMATIGSFFAKSRAPHVSTHFVEFTTEFDDGSEINTLNSPNVSIFRPIPHKTIRRIPHLHSLSSLHQVHCYLVGQEAGRSALLPPQGNEVHHLHASIGKDFGQQVELGYYFLDEAAQRYRLTWCAAITSAWRLLWPAKQIIQRRQEQDGKRIAEAAGISS